MGGGGGMGGSGGGMGGAGGHGGARHGDKPNADPAKGSSREDSAERAERGLARIFAGHVTITPLKQRIRVDDGDHPLELDRDGMNVSGPGVGGTVALSETKPDLVVDTLTDSGYALKERYHVADDGRHLELHLTLKRPGVDEPRELVRVFDRDVRTAAP